MSSGPKNRQERSPGSDLSVFGQWIEVLCVILGTSQRQIALCAGIQAPYLTKMCKTTYRKQLDIEKVSSVYDALLEIAEKKRVRMPVPKTAFFNSCGFATDEQRQSAEGILEMFRIGGSQRERLAHIQARIREQNEEINQLQRIEIEEEHF
jgi:hypothetical protein